MQAKHETADVRIIATTGIVSMAESILPTNHERPMLPPAS